MSNPTPEDIEIYEIDEKISRINKIIKYEKTTHAHYFSLITHYFRPN